MRTNQLRPLSTCQSQSRRVAGWDALPAAERDVSLPVLVTSLPLREAFVEQVDRPLVTWTHTHTHTQSDQSVCVCVCACVCVCV